MMALYLLLHCQTSQTSSPASLLMRSVIYQSLTHCLRWELLLIHAAERLQAGTDEMKRTAVPRYGDGDDDIVLKSKILAKHVLCQTSL